MARVPKIQIPQTLAQRIESIGDPDETVLAVSRVDPGAVTSVSVSIDNGPEDIDALALRTRKACDGLGFSILYVAEGSSLSDPLLIVEWRSLHGLRHGRVRTSCYARTLREAFEYIIEHERRAKEDGEQVTESWHRENIRTYERQHAVPKGR